MADLTAALTAQKPEIARSFVAIVTSQFERAQAALGADLKNIGNDWTWAGVWTSTLARFVSRSFNGSPAILHTDRLTEAAALYAEAVVAEWQAKIEQKLGEIENGTVASFGASRFNIQGHRFGRAVVIEQTMIINVSSKGKVFNQFPARIYVDGRALSEAKYKKLAA